MSQRVQSVLCLEPDASLEEQEQAREDTRLHLEAFAVESGVTIGPVVITTEPWRLTDGTDDHIKITAHAYTKEDRS